jgi:hypothetical protein
MRERADVLGMLADLEHPPTGGTLFAVLYRNAGWAIQFYEGPENEDDSTPDNWREFLRVVAYYPAFAEAVAVEYATRVLDMNREQAERWANP